MPIELRKISSSQLQGLPKEKTVFFYPVGALEDHGSHLPLGLDLEEASRLCVESAILLEKERPGWVGVLMPEAPLGIESNTTQFALVVRPYVLRDWLVDSCMGLMRNGFLHFVCFSGHLGPRQLTSIEEAGARIDRLGLQLIMWKYGFLIFGEKRKSRPRLISASSSLTSWRDVVASPFWPDPSEHGGKRDTSVALAICKELVAPDFASLPKQPQTQSRWKRNLNRRIHKRRGYWGDPSEADESFGKKEISETLDKVFIKMKLVWDGVPPRSLFRSWYSIFPPNKSFFKAWVLLAFICLFLGGLGILHSVLNDFN